MSTPRGGNKASRSKGKKKAALKDLDSKRSVKAGAATVPGRDPLQKLATNHNEILVTDTTP
jgi:hypothetical protein